MLKRLLCCFFLVIASGIAVGYAQSMPNNTKFWVSFMRNGGCVDPSSLQLTLNICAEEACQVTITNPNSGNPPMQVSVSDQGVKSIEIPYEYAYNDQKGGIADKGLLVVSTHPISLFVANKADESRDASRVLPVEELGTQYMLQTNKSIGECNDFPEENRASFLVVATQDDTHVEITPTCETFDGHPAGDHYFKTLNKGQCYHVINKNAGTSAAGDHNGDFSGTTVESDKPIAVFNGNCLTSVPGTETAGFNHIFEQAIPIQYWGRTFVVVQTNPPDGYYQVQPDWVKITARKDNTQVYRDNELMPLCSLNQGESVSFQLTSTNIPFNSHVYFESDEPIAVFLYTQSHQTGNYQILGDPSMAWIAPMEQSIEETNFMLLPLSNVAPNQGAQVKIVCRTKDISNLKVFKDNIETEAPSAFPSHVGEVSYALFKIDYYDCFKNYTIQCPGGFVAYAQFVGQHDAYGYSLPTRAANLVVLPQLVGPTQVAAATSFWPGEYTYELLNIDGINLSDIHWEIKNNPSGPGEWKLEPHGSWCVITVYSMGERELYVSWGDGIEESLSMTLHGSGYELGENETIGLEVFPNPACDEMRVRGCEMEEVNLYNLIGQKLRAVPSAGASEVCVNVSDLPRAMYLLEVRTLKGNKTLLVSVIN